MDTPDVEAGEELSLSAAITEEILDLLQRRAAITRAYSNVLRGNIQQMVSKAFYQRVYPDTLSDLDMVAVMLKVEDWRGIEQCLRDDADAESDGIAYEAWRDAHMGVDEGEIEATNPEYLAAIAEDAQAPCHDNGRATIRCADVIEETLRRNGWPG